MKSETWIAVTMRELRTIWAKQQRAGICFNGCTRAALDAKYGEDNVTHIRGGGFFRKAAGAPQHSAKQP